MKENKIEIKMFHEFDILINNESIFYKVTRLPVIIELLQYMLSNYDSDISPNVIAEDIWPDKNYTDSKKVLRTYIYRLKLFLSGSNPLNKDVSNDVIISNTKGRYKLTLSDKCSFDLKEFHERYKKIEPHINNLNDIEHIEDLLSIYKGDFLPNIINAHWVLPIRNLYLDFFCKLSNTVLSKYFFDSNHKEVIKISESIFEIYDLDEESNVLFLKSLIAENRISDALEHYSYITAKMYTELDVRPSQDLKQIYIQLKNPIATNTPQKIKQNHKTIIQPSNVFWRKFSYMTKRCRFKTVKKMTVALIRFYKEKYECIEEDESFEINESINYVLNNVFDNKYQFTFLNNQLGVLILNDIKQNFINNIPEMITSAWAENSKLDIFVEVNLKSVSPTERSNLKYEERAVVE